VVTVKLEDVFTEVINGRRIKSNIENMGWLIHCENLSDSDTTIDQKLILKNR
jgi:hypothetical protein